MKNHVRMICLAACLTLSLVILSGCSIFGPNSAKDVMEKYYSGADKIESYHLEGTMDMDVSMKIDSKDVTEMLGTDTIDMPVNMDLSMDVGKPSAHGDIAMDMSILGEKESTSVEMYYDIEKGYTYTKEDGSDTWYKQKTDKAFTDMAAIEIFDEDTDWDKFEFEKLKEGYKVSVNVKDLDSDFFSDIMTTYLEDVDFDEFEFGDEGKLVYEFDKSCRPVKSKIEDLLLTSSMNMDAAGDMSCDVVMNADFDMSKYNEVDEDDYEIPSKVKKDAIKGSSSGVVDPIEPVDPTEPVVDPTEPIGGGTGTGTILNGKDANTDTKHCFTVGSDIKAGTYKVYRTATSGSGVMTITDAENYGTNYTLNMGYGLDTDDPDGTEVVLDNGDQLYITQDLILEFK